MRQLISTRDIERFISDRPKLTRHQRGKLYFLNIAHIVKKHEPATEMMLYGWLKSMEEESWNSK